VEALQALEGVPAFRDVVEVLAESDDLALLERFRYFARTRALKLFCEHRGGRGPVPETESYAEWRRLLAGGAILGYGP
jgi:hypothetical protein